MPRTNHFSQLSGSGWANRVADCWRGFARGGVLVVDSGQSLFAVSTVQVNQWCQAVLEDFPHWRVETFGGKQYPPFKSSKKRGSRRIFLLGAAGDQEENGPRAVHSAGP